MKDLKTSVSPFSKRGSFVKSPSLKSINAPKPDLSEVTRCLNMLDQQDGFESEDVLPLVYDELRRHAGRRMTGEYRQNTLQPTALVHEAWLRVVGNGKKKTVWENRAHFFGAASRAMRRILIENIRRKTAIKRGGDWIRVDIEKIDVADSSPEERVLLIDDALEHFEMVSPEKSQVVMLKFYGGHTNSDVASMLGISERTVERHWAYAKAWLLDHICERDSASAEV